MYRIVVLAALLLVGLPATSARAASTRGTAVFALVVTNNRSATLGRPDLQYADDDGAHYYRLFHGVAGAGDVKLLTSFDRQSRTTYPDLVPLSRPPTRAALAKAVEELRAEIAAAHAAGLATAFYFVFAGHGDVVDGKGILDLADGPVDGAFLEAQVISRISADTEHVILDSCNSFFVFNPRKPGGRRWSTPKDMALGFSGRYPNVGLLLSTNSDAEVYEWSELESGIFSYEVRSGLTGAADVDGDGRVSYAELAGFIEIANRRIPRETFRPSIFWRGPGGDDGAALFPFSRVEGRRVVLDGGEQRLWIRGGDGDRLADLHKEAGRLTIVLPGPADQPLTVVEELAARSAVEPPTVREFDVGGTASPVALSWIAPREATNAARGGAEIFRNLFADAYGPRTYAELSKQRRGEPEPVYGISRADEARMRNALTMLASQGRSGRNVGGGAILWEGVTCLAIGGASLYEGYEHGLQGARVAGYVLGGIGAALSLRAIYDFSTPSEAERALGTFEEQLRAPNVDAGQVVANTERRLEDVATAERRGRKLLKWSGLIEAGFLGIFTATGEIGRIYHTRPSVGYAIGGSFTGLFLMMSAMGAYNDTPEERMLRLYHQDPAVSMHLDVALSDGGAVAVVGGRF